MKDLFKTKKTIIIFAIIVLIIFFSKTVFAVWNNTFYNPGDTLNPECLPTDTDCNVRAPLTSLSGAVLTNQTTPQTIGLTGARLAKLWATDINTTDLTVANTITGSISGNASTVTNATFTTALTVNGGAGTLTFPAAGTTLTIPTGGGTLGTNAFTSTAFQPTSEKNQSNGYAGLDSDSLISDSQVKDLAYIRYSEIDRLCSGLVSIEGGSSATNAITASSNAGKINIKAGIGQINSHTGVAGTYERLSWNAFNESNNTDVDITGLGVTNGSIYVAINYDGSVDVSSTKQTMGDHVYLGHVYLSGGNVIETFSIPEWTGHFQGRVNEWMSDAMGSLVATGNTTSEGLTPLTLSISGGEIYARLSPIDLNSTTTFTKFYNNNGTWSVDSNNPNYVDVTEWNNTSSGLVTMTDGYWKKDLVMRTPNGNVYYVFGQAEYATEDEARNGLIPVIPDAIKQDSVYLAVVVLQKGDTSVSSRLYDVRPMMSRIFGYGTTSSGVVVAHNSLIGLTTGDDHTQYMLLAGRDGGQTLTGGLTTTSDLILKTTSANAISGADMIFQTGNNGATEAMRILYNGNVGIGTISPSERLDVNGTDPRIYLADATVPGTTTNRLYSVSGNLTWNGVNLTGGGALPAGTEGQMLYNNAGTWTAHSGMYWNDTSNRLGIGISNPSATLHLYSSSQFLPQIVLENSANDQYGGYWNTRKSRSGGPVQISDALGTFIFQGYDSDNTVRNSSWFTASVEAVASGYVSSGFNFNTVNTSGVGASRMVIKAGGNVGIGIAAPGGLLHVASSTTATGLTIFEQASTDTDSYDLSLRKSRGTTSSPTTVVTGDDLGAIMFRGYATTNGYITNGGAQIKAIATGTIGTTRIPSALAFSTSTDATPSVLTERMRIDNAGNVGIGTVSPSSPLHLAYTNTTTTGTNYGVQILPTYNQASGDAANIDFLINRTETAVGSGIQYLFDAQLAGVSQFRAQSNGLAYVRSVFVVPTVRSASQNVILTLQTQNRTTAGNMVSMSTGTFSNSSGTGVALAITPTYNQTSTAAGTDLLINRTETAVGSGEQLLADFQVGGVSKAKIDNAGLLTTVKANIAGATLNTDADLSYSGASIDGSLIKNDNNTRTFSSLNIKPTLNAGASNANTTFNILNIDSTNTSLTGTTLNLLKMSSSGVARFSMTNGGNAVITSSASSGVGLTITTASLTTGNSLLIDSISNVVSSGDVFKINKTGTGSSTAFTGNMQRILYSQTFNGGTGLDSTGNVLNISRAITLNNAGNTHTISGALATLSDSGTQTAGTLTHTANVLSISQNYAAASGAVLFLNSAGSGLLADLQAGSVSKFSVTNAGVVQQKGCTTAGTLSADVSGNIICTASSQRFKYNITDLPNSLSNIMALRPVSYVFNPEMNLGNSIHLGFISEEVASVVPEFATHDINGNPYGLDTNAILSATVKAIQEMNLNLEGVAGTVTPLSGSTTESFMTAFFTNIKTTIGTWLADSTNGIAKIFTGEIETKSLCVSDDSGAKTCITKAQLDSLITGAGVSNVIINSTPAPEVSAPTPASAPENPTTSVTEIPTSETPALVTPVCVDPQILVNNVCTDPTPAVVDPITASTPLATPPTTPTADSTPVKPAS